MQMSHYLMLTFGEFTRSEMCFLDFRELYKPNSLKNNVFVRRAVHFFFLF